ncbi:MAG: hypothetical protein RIM99_20325 [Cyclobacteriaceae bacterium]
MKLLVITAVSTFEKPIRESLKKARVGAFSYTQVTGYKDLKDQPMGENWFSSGVGEHKSVLFYAFVPNELVDLVIQNIDSMNEMEESHSKIHVAVLDILKHNKE